MARLTPIDSIRVERRQRAVRDENDHQDLFVSIAEGEAGLIHAPMCWEHEGQLWLVAGEGRLTVIREMAELGLPLRYEGEIIPEGMVPYTLIGNTSSLGRYEAEYDENTKRTPLTVAEKAAATARLFELKKMRAEAEGKPQPTVAELNIEIRGPSGDYNNTRKELIIARHLDNPEVVKAKSIDEAFNIVKRGEMQRKAVQLAKDMGSSIKAHRVELHHADAREWLLTCPPAHFDIILSDPPYGIGADTFGVYNDSEDHRYDDSFPSWVALMFGDKDLGPGILSQLNRVTKPDAHLYLFCDIDRFHMLKKFLEAEKWKVHRTPLIWVNPNGFRTPWPEHGPQRKYEIILYARRGDKKVLKVLPDVVEYNREDGLHPAQKPVTLMRDLLGRSALPTDTVLDFCAGSASTLVAAHLMGLAAVGVEKEDVAYGTALKRLQTLTTGG